MATPNIVPRADREGGLGTASKSWGKLFIEQDTSGGTAATTISNKDVDQVALDINADNTTANIIDIDAKALTTGGGIVIDSDVALNQYGLIHLDIDDNNVSDLNRGGHGYIRVDYDKAADRPIGSGQTSSATSMYVTMNDAATNVGTMTMTGLNMLVNSVSNGGTVTNKGIAIDVDGADLNYGITIDAANNAGADIIMYSSANSADFATIDTKTNGELTLQTTDGDAALAHINLKADGHTIVTIADELTSGKNFIIKPAGALNAAVDIRAENGSSTQIIMNEAGGNSTSDYCSIDIYEHGETKIQTVDAAAAAAHLKFNIDGDIHLASNTADYGKTISFGNGLHFVIAEVQVLDANETDNACIKQIPGVKIPQYAHLVEVSLTITQLSNLGTYAVNLMLATNDGVSAGVVPDNVHEIIGAGSGQSYWTDDVNAVTDVIMSSGSGNLKKNHWQDRSNIVSSVAADGELTDDHYLYVCTAGTGNSTTDGTSGKVFVYIKYFGMD